MCGIVGVVAGPGGAPPDEEVGRLMTAALIHRGPDDEGIFLDARALLGMRRLAIIDPAGGHQPAHSDDGGIQVVFNGEIYNYRALRDDLRARGQVFRTNSDTEVIVRGYEAWGDDVFPRLEGMFAIAIWDARDRTLWLARDRFGEKPLFYARSAADGQLAFASELKALLRLPGFRPEIDPASVRSFLRFGYVPSPASIFEGVRKLPPGHSLKVADGAVTLRRYYRLALGPKLRLDEREAEDELARLLDQAVSSRLVSDVPFGAFLSGGLDSSVVVALMARRLGQPVRTFSIGFAESGYDELPDARRVARHLGTEHHELVVAPDAAALMGDIVWYLDEPFADASALPTYLVAKLARERVKMALTGDGGDETFAGYDRYLRFLYMERLGRLKPAAAAAARLAGGLFPREIGYRLRRIGERLREPFPDSYLTGVALTRSDIGEALLGEAVRASPADAGGAPLAAHDPALASLDSLDRCVAIDFASYLPDDILVKLDRMAMASSLEGRAPLLDHRLVEFGVRLPARLRVRGRRGKHLLRRVAGRWLPREVLEKPKQGFAVPLGRWFRGPLAELAADLFASRRFKDRGLIRPEAAEGYLRAHLAHEADHGEVLWSIVSLELWARRFLDGAVAG